MAAKKAAETVLGHAVFDHDANQIAMLFPNGSQKQQAEDAQLHLDGLLGHTGEHAERNLELVKVVAA
jgi:hypothetical protein